MSRRRMILYVIIILVAAGTMGGAISSYLEAGQGDYTSKTESKGQTVFHVILADSNLYAGGVYRDSFDTRKSETFGSQYFFDFVPNGSSPDIISITLSGENFEHTQDFVLNGTRHEAWQGEFYTWEYLGNKSVSIPYHGTVEIAIDPHGSTQGSVSVYVIHGTGS